MRQCPVLALASSYPASASHRSAIDSLARDTATIAGQWTHHRAKKVTARCKTQKQVLNY